jgi:hypothetical protein
VATVFGLEGVDKRYEAEVQACLGKTLEALAAESENGILIVHVDDDDSEADSIAATKAIKAEAVRAVKLLDQGQGVADSDIQEALGLPRKEVTWLLAECVEGGFLRCSKPNDNTATVYWIPTLHCAHQETNQGPSTTQSPPVDDQEQLGSRRQLGLFDDNPSKEA